MAQRDGGKFLIRETPEALLELYRLPYEHTQVDEANCLIPTKQTLDAYSAPRHVDGDRA